MLYSRCGATTSRVWELGTTGMKATPTKVSISGAVEIAVGHYFAPAAKKARAVAPVMTAVLLASSSALGWWLGAVYTLGLAASYVGYEVFHRRIHTHAPRGPFGRWARSHHLYHHYVDPKTNHGVTTHLGDIVMRTLVRPPRPIRVPERLATAWLLDGSTGELRREFAADYVLVKLPSNR